MFDRNEDSFDWRDRPFGETRFPEGVRGWQHWHDWVPMVEQHAASGEESALPIGDPTTKLSRPRLFVSHKQQDEKKARRIAWLATRCGFNFWLDVLDPKIDWLTESNFDKRVRSLLIARTIEIALLNCTHVVALITKRSVSSRWIPYEYGRVKERSVVSALAASWVAPGQKHLLTEYMHLGKQLFTEREIRAWLLEQRRWFLTKNHISKLPPRSKTVWKGSVPKTLPGGSRR